MIDYPSHLRAVRVCCYHSAVVEVRRQCSAPSSDLSVAERPAQNSSRCSEQSRRKPVTQSYGTKATFVVMSAEPPASRPQGRSWRLFFWRERMPFTFKRKAASFDPEVDSLAARRT